MATTAQAAISGCSSIAASMSSGWMLTPRRSNNHLALAAQKPQLARFLPLRNVSGRQPFFLRAGGARRPARWRSEIMGPRTSTSPSGASLTSRPAMRLADGALGHVEGMVERDERGGLGHAVALHQHESERVPELLKRPRQRAAAGDESPEFKTELAMHGAEAPPAAPGVEFLRAGDAFGQAADRRLPDGP